MFDWTEDRVAMLRKFVADRKSSGYAARALDPTGRLTRNSVTSKAAKLGLRFNSRTDLKSKAANHRRRRSAHSEQTLAQYAGERLPPVAFTPDPASIDADAIPVEQRKTLLELTPHSCRWPFGDPQTPEFFYCGAHTADNAAGIPYCRTHSRIAYNRPPKPQQSVRAAA